MNRYDLADVPPQGGYVAKQCPVRAQNNVLRPCEPLPPSRELQRRFDRGREFEDAAAADLEDASEGVVVTVAGTQEELEVATTDAIANRAPIIVGGRLPTDLAGKRVGKPDLLVRASDGGYRPVDIKHHMALGPGDSSASKLPALCSSIDAPTFEEAVVDPAYFAQKREDDLLQLAHYQRMLEAAGLAPPDGRWAGIIGTEERTVWYDLDAAIWTTPSSSGKQKRRSTMERYDFEFDFRLDVIAVARDHLRDPSVDLLVVPAAIDECPTCPWRDYCREQLEAGSGDVSLLPRIGWRQRQIHAARNVTTRDALARLDLRTARLVSGGVDVIQIQALIEDLPPEMPIADLSVVIRSKKQLAALEAEGMRTFGDVAALPSPTAAYGDSLSTLPEQIDLARAALGPDAIYRRRGVSEILVPRADIEVDVDMENIETGVYLWGALRTDHSEANPKSEYHDFSVWEPLDPTAEADNSLRFWSWLNDLRSSAAQRGQTFGAYCYNASAENTYLRRLGLSGGLTDEVDAFIASDQWVDMLKVVNEQLITGGGLGLKKVAPIAGYDWLVRDPGGGFSMVQYDTAVAGATEGDRAGARGWLLAYNRGDVEATLAIRDWLDLDGASVARIESIDAEFANPPAELGTAP
jgi:predicted RecB family nuclease